MNANAQLRTIAKRVNWYAVPGRLLENRDLFLCQVMARAGVDDLIAVRRRFSKEDFQNAYLHAPPGLFTKRAWRYWGLVLDHADRPLPERFPGANQFDWRRNPVPYS